MKKLHAPLARLFLSIWSTPVGRELIRYGSVSLAVVGIFIALPTILSPNGHEALLVGLAGVITITAFFSGIMPAVMITLLASFLAYVSRDPVEITERIQAYQESFIILGFGALMIGIKWFHHKQSRTTVLQIKQFRTLLDHSLYPLLLKDAQGNITYASATAAELLGHKEHELYKRNLSEFIHPQDRPALKNMYTELFRRPKKRMAGEFRAKRKNQSWIWLKTDAINLLGEDSVRSVVVNLRDITERKHIDAERMESLKREQDARALAEQAVRARDEFLSIASHELKTPLTTVLLQLQATLRRTSTQSLAHFSGEKLVKSLTIAEQQSKRLSELIKDLLNVSLITTGRITLKKETVELGQLISLLIERLEEQIKDNGTTISLVKKDQVVGKWDVVRLEQCISNLLTNALKYGGGKPVEITIWQDVQWAYVAVKDAGHGIQKDHQERIFELFQRAVTTEDIKGLGVGLFIARRIAHAHGGNIHIKSAPGEGSIFTVQLPLSAA